MKKISQSIRRGDDGRVRFLQGKSDGWMIEYSFVVQKANNSEIKVIFAFVVPKRI